MSGRKQGSNKRPPRTQGPKSPCISYNINNPGVATIFTPKVESHCGYTITANGKFMPTVKEKELS